MCWMGWQDGRLRNETQRALKMACKSYAYVLLPLGLEGVGLRQPLAPSCRVFGPRRWTSCVLNPYRKRQLLRSFTADNNDCFSLQI
jgi:hypothetical protein